MSRLIVLLPVSLALFSYSNKSMESCWDEVERRRQNRDRRNTERRSYLERRYDRRVGGQRHLRNLSGWLRSLVKRRLGVDRRKNVDRRAVANDRRLLPSPRLTKKSSLFS